MRKTVTEKGGCGFVPTGDWVVVILNIVDKFVGDLKERLAKQKVFLELTDAARRHLARVIQDQLKRPLSNELLFGNLTDGGKVTVDYRNGKFEFDTGA